MANVNGELPDLITKKDRSFDFKGQPQIGFITVIDEKEGNTIYLMERRAIDGVYLLTKQGDETTQYEVRPNGCTCWGFRRWGKCKHFHAVLAVRAKLW